MAPSVFVIGDTSVVVHNLKRYEALICYGTIGNIGTTIFGITLNAGNVELHDICGKSAISSLSAVYDGNSGDLTLSFAHSSSFRVLHYQS